MINLNQQNKHYSKCVPTVLKVFYDGSCPLCTKEINIYQRQTDASKINWVDVNSNAFENESHGLNRKIAIKRFHVVLSNGKLLSGAHAFIRLWLSLENFYFLGRLLNTKITIFILEKLYVLFLRFRPAIQWIFRRFVS